MKGGNIKSFLLRYWQGKEPFWRAFWLWAVALPFYLLPLTLVSKHAFYYVWMSGFAHYYLNFLLIFFLPYAFIYLPVSVKILWACRLKAYNRLAAKAALVIYGGCSVMLLATVAYSIIR